jgi:ribonuclease P protein component
MQRSSARLCGGAGPRAVRLVLASVDSFSSASGAQVKAMTRMETGREADLPAQREEAGQAPRLPRSHVDSGRSGDPALPATEGPRSPVGVTWRLRGPARIAEVSRTGRSGTSGVIRLRYLPPVADQPPTVAYAIPKAVGSAVTRNRVRRRLRPLVAQAAADGALAPGRYLVTARPPAGERTSADLGRDLRAALAALAPSVTRP